MEKKDLRAFIRAKKRAMTSAQVEAASARLAEKLFQHPAYQAAKSLYGYLSYNQEVRTAAILRQAQRDGKRVAAYSRSVFCPRCDRGRQACSRAEGVWRRDEISLAG